MFKLAKTCFTLLCALFFVHATPAASPDAFDPSSLFNLNLVTHINAFITLDSLTTNLISINFDVDNTLILPLVINSISSNAGLNGTVFASFQHTFNPPFTILPFQTKNSGNISNVLLTQGATASLDIIPFGILDIDSDITVLGIPIDGLKQSSVSTTYTLDLS